MNTFLRASCIAAALGAANVADAAVCTAGQIDTSFGPAGSAGFVQVAPWLPGAPGNFEGLVYGSDNHLYAPNTVATNADQASYAGLVRVSRSGRLDNAFAGFGFASPGLQQGTGVTGNLAQDTSGNTVFAISGNGSVSVSRLLADGTPDTSFGTHGATSFPLADTFGIVGVTTASDGSIFIVTGAKNAAAANPQQPVVVKLTPAGALDTSFGAGGYAYFIPAAYAASSSLGRATDIALLPSGDIVVTGRLRILGTAGAHYQMFLARLHANGSIDASFATAGYSIVDAGDTYSALGRKLAIQPDGKVVTAGTVHTLDGSSSGVAVYRMNADGSLDTGFGTGGYTVTPTGFGAFGINLALQDNGKIVVGGASFSDVAQTQNYGIVLRYTSAGVLDSAFASGGILNLVPAGPAASATASDIRALALMGSDKIAAMFAGASTAGTGSVWLTAIDTGRGRGCH